MTSNENNLTIRKGNLDDLQTVKNLAFNEWRQYQQVLTSENWDTLKKNLTHPDTFLSLLQNTDSFICENKQKEIIGFCFLVSSGNPNDIYSANQCYIRFVTVSKEYKGLGIGKKLTEACILKAKENNEKVIALHTSEFMNAARHIYEQCGFRITRELPSRLGKKYWLYELIL